MIVRNYCTLFDSKYLAKGLALHASMLRHSTEPFVLYMLAMDHETFQILDELKLQNVRLMPLESFETAMGMKSVRESRSLVEYFWTCASSLCEYLMKHVPLDSVTYLDADLFFFSDPKAVFDEMGERSIAIIPHRFAEQDRNRLEKNGKFNVGWISFKGATGLKCLQRWAAQCREWCFYRNEDGKFGDQAYLDSWTEQYGKDLAIIENPGVGLAPWNLQQYQPQAIDAGILKGIHLVHLDELHEIVFYHFHEYRSESDLTRWPLRPIDREIIYAPYIQELRRIHEEIVKTAFAIAERRNLMQLQGERA